jgi:hypothetical protein
MSLLSEQAEEIADGRRGLGLLANAAVTSG